MGPLALGMVGIAGSCAAGAIGMLLLLSGGAKAAHPGAFAAEIAAWRLLPLGAATAAAHVLVALQLGIGMWLLSGVEPARAAWAGIGVLMLFAVAMTINLLRGRTALSCGCIPGVASVLSWGSVGRNLLLVATLGCSVVAGPMDAEWLRIEMLAIGGCLTLLSLARMTLMRAETVA